jgi:lipopolysaccharide export system permease protein
VLGPTILDRYVFRELVVSFFFCFAVFLFTGLIAGFLPLLQKGLEAGMELTRILFQVLISALPGTLVTVLPLSMTVGILMGLGRLASDNEIAAMKSSGISVTRLLPPVAIMGIIGTALSLLCTVILIPRGISEGRRLMQEALTQRLDAGIDERTFFDGLKNLILYVEKIDSATGVMSRVFLRESSQPDEVTTIIAEKGKASTDALNKALILTLRNGTLLKENRHGDFAGGLTFETYTFRYALVQAASDAFPPLEELSIAGIRDRVRTHTTPKEGDTPEVLASYERQRTFARALIAQRLSYPLACLSLALMAFPLGVLNMGRSRLNNVSMGLVALFAYYAFTLATERMARSGMAPPELMLPLPPLVFSLAGAYFAHCVKEEKIPGVVNLILRLMWKVRKQTP